jgi:hypothetical protein
MDPQKLKMMHLGVQVFNFFKPPLGFGRRITRYYSNLFRIFRIQIFEKTRKPKNVPKICFILIQKFARVKDATNVVTEFGGWS